MSTTTALNILLLGILCNGKFVGVFRVGISLYYIWMDITFLQLEPKKKVGRTFFFDRLKSCHKNVCIRYYFIEKKKL